MEKALQTLRYLSKSFAFMTIVGFLTILGGLLSSELIFALTDQYDHVITIRRTVILTVPFEITAGIFALLIGLVFFITNFKVSLANGISRKTYWLANLPAAGMAAAVLALFNLLIVLVYSWFRPVDMMIELLYPHTGWAGLFLFQFALYFFLIVIGWFINMAYYRSSGLGKWAVTFAPVGLYVIFRLVRASFGGWIDPRLDDYLHLTLRTPYSAAVSMLVYAIILCGLVYWLIRRAPLKD